MADGIDNTAQNTASLQIKIAVVQVYLGESNQEAWLRHLQDHPEDAAVKIRVFNHTGQR